MLLPVFYDVPLSLFFDYNTVAFVAGLRYMVLMRRAQMVILVNLGLSASSGRGGWFAILAVQGLCVGKLKGSKSSTWKDAVPRSRIPIPSCHSEAWISPRSHLGLPTTSAHATSLLKQSFLLNGIDPILRSLRFSTTRPSPFMAKPNRMVPSREIATRLHLSGVILANTKFVRYTCMLELT
jgi:hypothetical protein